jgi:PAS domain S-box-containing protein
VRRRSGIVTSSQSSVKSDRDIELARLSDSGASHRPVRCWLGTTALAEIALALKATSKLIGSLAGAALLVAIVAWVSVRSIRQIEEPAAARKHTFDVIGRADALLSALKDAETGQRGYLLTGDTTFLEPYLVVRDTVDAQRRELGLLVVGTSEKQHVDAMAPLLRAKMAELSRTIALRRVGDMGPVLALVTSGEGKALMDSIRVEIAALVQEEEVTLAEHEAAFQSNIRHLFTTIAVASLLALLLALAFALSIYRETRYRLRNAALLETKRSLEAREEANAQLQLANTTLQVSEERLAVTLGSIGDGVIATDANGRVTLLNSVAEELSGWSSSEALGRPVEEIFQIINQESRQPATVPVAETLAQGVVKGLANHTALIARDGRERSIADSCAPIRDRQNTVVGAVLVFRDVTEEYVLARLRLEQSMQVEEASRMKSEFLANMSHELRTPLNAIIGFSEALMDGLMGDMTDQQRGFIGDIFGSGTHLLSLINDILDLSKVEAGKMTLDLETVNLPTFLSSCLSIVRENASARNIRLSMDAADDAKLLQADARKLKQIVYNLLSNAVKFSKNGGEVTVIARRVARDDVGLLSGPWAGRSCELPDSPFPEFLKISVNDAGIGMSPDGFAQLFTPFSQIDSGLSRKFEGTGLGLALVRVLAELHGGTVAVESAEGQGSRFTVWLPFRAATPDESNDAPKNLGGPRDAIAPGARVALVVEDDPKSAQLIRVQLEAEGFTVLCAARAEDALVLAVQQPLALITLDVQLPHMDGWELLTVLKRSPALKYVPVMIISIVSDPHKGFALGAAAVLQKPISRQEMYESLVSIGLLPLARGKTLNVLVVDDSPAAVELLAVRLESFASSVLRASNGRDAIDIARRELPDLIILDLMMPEMNGFEVVEALQGQPDTARIPVLVVTAKIITAEDRARLSGYVTAVMEKAAFDPARFAAEVRRATARSVVPTSIVPVTL